MNDLHEIITEPNSARPAQHAAVKHRPSMRRLLARGAVAVTAIATLGALTGPAAHADVWAGSGYATTGVRCESSNLTLSTLVTPIGLDGTVFIKPTIYKWNATSRQWVVATSFAWKQVWSYVNIPFSGIPHGYYYVRMDYAFGTSSGWVYRSEWITDYQSGAYLALANCAV